MNSDYTAIDILEACGLDPCGAPRVVVVAAELLALCQRGRRIITEAHFRNVPHGFPVLLDGEFYPSIWPLVEWDCAVAGWGKAMGQELGIRWRATVHRHRDWWVPGNGQRIVWRYAADPRRGKWRALEIVETDEDSAEWWVGCTYPLKRAA